MNALFVAGPDLNVLTRDGRNCTLLAAKLIQTDTDRYRMPVGAQSDGASIPQALWSLGLAPFGVYWPAAFAHDCAFRGTLEVLVPDPAVPGGITWRLAMLSEDQSNDLLNALMFALGTPEPTRIKIYEGVKFGGWKAFREDRAHLPAIPTEVGI